MRVRAINATTVGAGARLGLSKAQAGDRVHMLKDCGKGIYELAAPAFFKAGEEFDFVGELPKSLGTNLQPIHHAKPKATANTAGMVNAGT